MFGNNILSLIAALPNAGQEQKSQVRVAIYVLVLLYSHPYFVRESVQRIQ